MTTDPQRFRHRTPEIEAVQWTGSNEAELSAFCSPFDFQIIDPEDRIEDPDQTAAVRESAHGTWRGLAPGDWVVKLDGGFYECSAANFAERYEPAAVPSVPAGRAGLRDHIAAAVDEGFRLHAELEDANLGESITDSVLAVLPPSVAVGRSAKAEALLLHFTAEAHRRKWAYDRGLDDDGVPLKSEAFDALHQLGDEMSAALHKLRRMADEAQQPEAQAHPPYHRWYVETLDDVADEWAPGMRFTDRAEAMARYEAVSRNHPTWKDGAPVKRRFVRETTSYTVEAEHTPAVVESGKEA